MGESSLRTARRHIAKRTDVLSLGHLYHGMMGMHREIHESTHPLVDWPSLLHSDPKNWPGDRNEVVSKFDSCYSV